MPAALGKQRLLEVWQGSCIKENEKEITVLAQTSKLGRLSRWIACSAAPAYLKVLEDDKDVQWSESSCLSNVVQSVESSILCAWTDYIRRKATTHLSKHYDGLRVDLQRAIAEDQVDVDDVHGVKKHLVGGIGKQ